MFSQHFPILIFISCCIIHGSRFLQLSIYLTYLSSIPFLSFNQFLSPSFFRYSLPYPRRLEPKYNFINIKIIGNKDLCLDPWVTFSNKDASINSEGQRMIFKQFCLSQRWLKIFVAWKQISDLFCSPVVRHSDKLCLSVGPNCFLGAKRPLQITWSVRLHGRLCLGMSEYPIRCLAHCASIAPRRTCFVPPCLVRLAVFCRRKKKII